MTATASPLRTAIRHHARIAAAAAEIASARQMIRAVSISSAALRNAGMTQAEADSFFATLRAVELCIDAVALASARDAADAQDEILDLADRLAK